MMMCHISGIITGDKSLEKVMLWLTKLANLISMVGEEVEYRRTPYRAKIKKPTGINKLSRVNSSEESASSFIYRNSKETPMHTKVNLSKRKETRK